MFNYRRAVPFNQPSTIAQAAHWLLAMYWCKAFHRRWWISDNEWLRYFRERYCERCQLAHKDKRSWFG